MCFHSLKQWFSNWGLWSHTGLPSGFRGTIMRLLSQDTSPTAQNTMCTDVSKIADSI